MGRWPALCTALLLVASCSGSTAGLQASPSPSQSACRLPAMLWSYPDGETQGGFINSVSGIFTPDPGSLMVLDNPSGLMRTPDKPFLFGTGDADGLALVGASYDLSQHRWLPVP